MPFIVPIITTVASGIGSVVSAVGGAIGSVGSGVGSVLGAGGAAAGAGGGIGALGYASLGLSALSTVAQAKQQREMGKVAQQTAEYNAKVQENQAIQASMESQEQARRQKAINAKLLGTQRTGFASSGVVSSVGSPLEVLGETAGMIELEYLDANRAAERARSAGMARGAMTRFEGASTARGYKNQSYGTILSGASSLLSSYGGMKNAGVFAGGG